MADHIPILEGSPFIREVIAVAIRYGFSISSHRYSKRRSHASSSAGLDERVIPIPREIPAMENTWNFTRGSLEANKVLQRLGRGLSESSVLRSSSVCAVAS
jgi:hypothetical protein